MIDETNRDFLQGNVVNFLKCTKLADVVITISAYQLKPFNFRRVDSVMQYVEMIPGMVLKENDCYELSVKHEPRE